MKISVKSDRLIFGDEFAVSFERTFRIPDDGKTYPLPPSVGHFPILKVDDYRDSVPEDWLVHGGVFIPLYQREALWIRFQALRGIPHAVKVAVGKVNAVSGKTWDESLSKDNEDYLVCPPQPWLDGINAGDGVIRQFVAMPLGMGYTVEAQVTGKEEFGGVQMMIYPPTPDQRRRFEKAARDLPLRRYSSQQGKAMMMSMAPSALDVPTFLRKRDTSPAPKGGTEMGLGAGGKMSQKIYPDPHGLDTWDQSSSERLFIHLVNSAMFEQITGRKPPDTPITAKSYEKRGYPWFDVYDESYQDIAAPDELQKVKSVKEMDAEKGFDPQQDDESVETPNVITYKMDDPDELRDGEW